MLSVAPRSESVGCLLAFGHPQRTPSRAFLPSDSRLPLLRILPRSLLAPPHLRWRLFGPRLPQRGDVTRSVPAGGGRRESLARAWGSGGGRDGGAGPGRSSCRGAAETEAGSWAGLGTAGRGVAGGDVGRSRASPPRGRARPARPGVVRPKSGPGGWWGAAAGRGGGVRRVDPESPVREGAPSQALPAAVMSEDSSALPWSINRDDYELQEVIGESRGPEPCGAPVRGVRLGWGSLCGERRTWDRRVLCRKACGWAAGLVESCVSPGLWALGT